MAEVEEPTQENYKLPSKNTMEHACKIAIVEDKPIMLDYWVDSLSKNVLIGVKDNDEKLLVKNSEEYTSPIIKIFKLDNVYIICTENSIYITSSEIDKRRITS